MYQLPSLEEINEIYERNNLSKTANYYRKGCAACLVGALAIDAGVEFSNDGTLEGLYNGKIEQKLNMTSIERGTIVNGYDDGFLGLDKRDKKSIGLDMMIEELYEAAYAIGAAHREEQNATTPSV